MSRSSPPHLTSSIWRPQPGWCLAMCCAELTLLLNGNSQNWHLIRSRETSRLVPLVTTFGWAPLPAPIPQAPEMNAASATRAPLLCPLPPSSEELLTSRL